MDLFTYLMAKKGHNTHRDLFSYLLGKNAGGSGTYTTFSGTSLNISNTLQAKIKNIALEGNASQDGTPTPDTPIPIKVVTGEQNVEIKNSDSTLSQTYPLSLGNIELARIGNYKDYIFKNVVGSPYYNADLDLNGWYLHKEINKIIFDGTETGWIYYTAGGAYKRLELSINDIIQYTSRGNVLANYFKYLGTDIINEPGNIFSLNKNIYLYPETSISSVNEWKSWLSTHKTEVYYPLENSTNTKITDTTLVSQLENINNNARSYKDTTIIECTSASTDNEVIGFSGEIKVTSVSLGNSLNTSLLSSNLQEETNINDIQEEPNLDDVNEIEEQNDEPIEGKIEELIEKEVS